ncbi:MAG: transporter, partial [Burkholderiaceae bacterium]|nr:transporter [Burkholderiaceae bacterium]
MKFNTTTHKSLAVVSAVAMMLALGACSKSDDGKTAGQKLDSAVAKTEQKAGEMKADIKKAAAEAKAPGQSTAAMVGE